MPNKYGLILNTYVYALHRANYVAKSLKSLAQTNIEGLEQPILQFTIKPSAFDYGPYLTELEQKFLIQVDLEDYVCKDKGKGIDPTFINSINNILMLYPEITHVTYLTDDILYNKDWLLTLDALIERHPDAKAWTVYRSSNTRHHRVMVQDRVTQDCMVTSIAGVGTMSRQEWEEYGLDGKQGHGYYSTPATHGGGNTVDLHHAYARPGSRWATGRDYWEHIGDSGSHSLVNIDKALDFVGE